MPYLSKFEWKHSRSNQTNLLSSNLSNIQTLKDAKQIEKEAIKMIEQMEYGEHEEGKTS